METLTITRTVTTQHPQESRTMSDARRGGVSCPSPIRGEGSLSESAFKFKQTTPKGILQLDKAPRSEDTQILMQLSKDEARNKRVRRNTINQSKNDISSSSYALDAGNNTQVTQEQTKDTNSYNEKPRRRQTNKLSSNDVPIDEYDEQSKLEESKYEWDVAENDKANKRIAEAMMELQITHVDVPLSTIYDFIKREDSL